MAATSALLGYNGDCVIDAKNATFTTSTNNNGSGKIAYSAGVGVSEGRINATFTGSQIVSTATAANGFAQSAGIYTYPYVTDSQTPKNGDISVSLDSSKIQVKSEGVDNSNSLMTLPSGAYGIVGELGDIALDLSNNSQIDAQSNTLAAGVYAQSGKISGTIADSSIRVAGGEKSYALYAGAEGSSIAIDNSTISGDVDLTSSATLNFTGGTSSVEGKIDGVGKINVNGQADASFGN